MISRREIMHFKNFTQSDINVVSFTTKALDAANSNDFKAEIASLLDSGDKFLFDLGELQFIDSSGLGAILSCLKSVAARKGEIKLCNLTRPARIIIELVNMHKVFDIYNSVEEGLKSF